MDRRPSRQKTTLDKTSSCTELFNSFRPPLDLSQCYSSMSESLYWRNSMPPSVFVRISARPSSTTDPRQKSLFSGSAHPVVLKVSSRIFRLTLPAVTQFFFSSSSFVPLEYSHLYPVGVFFGLLRRAAVSRGVWGSFDCACSSSYYRLC